MNLLKKIQVHKKQYGTSGTVVRIFHFAFRQIGFVWETFYYMEKVLTSGILEVKNNTGYIIRKLTFDDFLKGDASYFTKILKSASNLNGNLNCSKELEHYAS